MTAALGTLGAIGLFVALCIVLGIVAWALVRIHECRVHRQAINHRWSEIAHGDVPAMPKIPVHRSEY